MSIGATDKLWWERVCHWLERSPERQIIFYCHKMPAAGVIEVDRQIEERNARRRIMQYSQSDEQVRLTSESRIHVTGVNLFQEINNLVQVSEGTAFYRSKYFQDNSGGTLLAPTTFASLL